MEKLRTPLMIGAVYLILLGLASISPSLFASVFGYDVKDPGVLRVLSSIFLGFGVVAWGIASNVEKHGDLATAIVVAYAIGILFLLWGFAGGLYTARNALVPLIINIVVGAWVWSARPKS